MKKVHIPKTGPPVPIAIGRPHARGMPGDGRCAEGIPTGEVRRWKMEDGRRKTEVGGRKTEDGRRKTEVGRWKMEDGSRKSEVGRWKREDRSSKLEARSLRLALKATGVEQIPEVGDRSVVLCGISVSSVVKNTTAKSYETRIHNAREPADVRIRDGTEIRIRDGTTIRARDGTVIRIRDGTTNRARDGTFLREKIPKEPALIGTGEKKTNTVNNRKTGLNGSGMKKDGRRKHEDGSPIEFKPSFGKERIEKMDTSSVVLCENSVYSVVKKDLTTENHKEGTENTKRSKMKNMNFNSVVLCENSVCSEVKLN